MRIFVSYAHDEHEPLVQQIAIDLEHRGHDVWFDRTAVKGGQDWRRAITDGIVESDRVVAFLSKRSTRDPGVCLDEIAIAVGVKGGNITTILLESEQEVQPPPSISYIQWLDLQDWQERRAAGELAWETWYQQQHARIAAVVESDDSRRFTGEIRMLEQVLEPISFESRLAPLLRKPLVGRAWLSDAVERWRTGEDSSSRLFWIVGPPGVGKSAFAAHFAHYGRDRVIAIQFCEYDKPDHGDVHRVIRTLVFQMATRLPDYRALLLSLPELTELERKNPAELFEYLVAGPLQLAIRGGRERYLLVIDALDEASRNGRNELVDILARSAARLPAWIGLVVTSRPESDVAVPLQGLKPVRLDTDNESNRADIREYIRRELSPCLENRADTDTLVEQVLDKSEGIFLYVELFCDDVRRGHISLDRPDRFPLGLGGIFFQYFQRQFPDLPRFRTIVRPVLRAVLAAREPLPAAIVQEIFNWTQEEFHDLTLGLSSLFPVSDGRGMGAIAPYHKSLADWLGDAVNAGPYFVSVSDGHSILAESGWTQYGGGVDRLSPYTLRHLQEHLIEANRPADAVALARDPRFLDAQASAVADEPRLPLITIERALSIKAQQDDAVSMAELVLTLAQRASDVFQQSPLTVLRAGHLRTACTLADLYPPDYAVLWKMLLTWELVRTGRPEDARAVQHLVREAPVIDLKDWKGRYAVQLLSQLIDLGADTVKQFLRGPYFNDAILGDLVSALLDRKAVSIAAGAAMRISDQRARNERLTEIARVLTEIWKEHAHAGRVDEAAAARTLALELLEHVLGREGLEAATTGHARDGHDDTGESDGMTDARAIAAKYLEELERDKSAGERDRDTRDATRIEIALAKAADADYAGAYRTVEAVENSYRRYEVISQIAVQESQALGYESVHASLERLSAKEERERAWHSIALASTEAGNLGLALRIVEDLDENEWWRVDALKHIALSQVEAGDFDAALHAANRMNRGWTDHHDVLLSIAAAQLRAGYETDALATLGLGLVPDVVGFEELPRVARQALLVCLGSLQVLGGDDPGALSTAQELSSAYKSDTVFDKIAKKHLRARDFSRVHEIAAMMQEGWSRNGVLTALARELTKAGRVQAARETVSRLTEPRDEVYELRDMAIELMKSGDRSSAMSAIRAAREAAARIANGPERVGAFAGLVKTAVELGDTDTSQDLVRSAQHIAGGIEGRIEQSQALRHVAEAHASMQAFSDALVISAELERRGAQDGGLLYVIATEQAKAGRLSEAWATAKSITDEVHRVRILASLVRDFTAAYGDRLPARVREMSAFATAIESPGNRADALAMVGEAAALTGLTEESRTAFETARQTANAIEGDDNARAVALMLVAHAQARGHDFPGALKTAVSIEDTYRRESALGLLAGLQAEAGEGPAALQTLELIRVRPTADLATVARRLADRQDISSVKQVLAPASRQNAATVMVEILGRLYPRQTLDIARVVARFAEETRR